MQHSGAGIEESKFMDRLNVTSIDVATSQLECATYQPQGRMKCAAEMEDSLDEELSSKVRSR